MKKDLFGRPAATRQKSTLGKKFFWSPFSVFNAREGDWQDRKREWISLGIRSELGRGEGLTINGDVGSDIDTYRHKEGKKKYGVTFGTDGKERDVFADREAEEQRERLLNESGKKYHAQPGGGPSKRSVWLGANGKPVGGDNAINASKQTASLKGGLVFGTTTNPYRPFEGNEASQTGTSIFDPVLCELFYKWFTPAKGLILDPFAGGSVRGIVASKLNRDYIGIDLRPEQILANEQQALEICEEGKEPIWLEGDSRYIQDLVADIGVRKGVDAVFSCPPYFDLEVYSGDNRDLSNTTWEGFCEAYKEIITQCVELMKPNRFACFVVGDLRDKDGFYRSLPAVTTQYFEEAGARFYNEAHLITAVGSLPLRIGQQFTVSRKLGRSHQTILVYVKGDPRKAAEACEPFELMNDLPKATKPKVE